MVRILILLWIIILSLLQEYICSLHSDKSILTSSVPKMDQSCLDIPLQTSDAELYGEDTGSVF